MQRVVVVGAVVAIVAAVTWFVFRDQGPSFSDDPRARKVAFARADQADQNTLILYHRCGEDDLIPYVDAAEVIGDDLREWEVAAELWHTNEASWMARRHPVGEEEPPPEPYEGSLPPPSEVRLNVHVYGAAIEDRWHVRVDELNVSDLPIAQSGPSDVLTADGETMARDDWTERADASC